MTDKIDTKFIKWVEGQTVSVIVTDDQAGNNIIRLGEITGVFDDHYRHEGEMIPLSHSVLWIGVRNILADLRSQDALGRRAGKHFFGDVFEDGWATANQIAKLGIGPVICTCVMNESGIDRMNCRFYFKSEEDAVVARATLVG